ncbi:uncharacterized protein LOC120345885 [Styela clava]
MFQSTIKKQIEIFTSRGNEYLAQAVKSGQKDAYAKAIQEFVKSYKFALLLNSKDGMEQICAFNLGAAHIAGGDTARGINVLHTVLEHETFVKTPSILPNSQSEKGDVYFNLAIGYEKIGDIEKASKFYQLALLAYGNNEKNQQKAAETNLKLANIYNKQNELSEARKHFLHASDIYQKLQDTENMVLALICQANAAVSDSTVSREECIRLLGSCCKKSAALKHANLQGKILCEVGLMYATLSCLNRALLCFEKSIRLCNKNTNPRRRAIALQNSGAILNSMGFYGESIPRHSESAQMHGLLGNRNAQGQSFCNLAFAQSQLQMYEEASESYLHALQAFRDTEDKQGQWQCHEGLGSIAFNSGSLDKAVEHFTFAVSIQTQKDSLESRKRIVGKLTNAIEMRADKKIVSPKLQLAIEENKEKNESMNDDNILALSPIILHNDSVDGRKSQKSAHTRHRKKKKKSLVRGRRRYSDENDRPVQHIARGISNLTQNSNPFSNRSYIENDGYSSGGSTASSELRAVFDMPRSGIFVPSSESSSEDEYEKALTKPKNRRRKLRYLVEASTMPINALTANCDKDTQKPDSADSTPRTERNSDGNLTQVYRDQLNKIEEKADEEDFTSVTSQSTDSSESSSSEDEELLKEFATSSKKVAPIKPVRAYAKIATSNRSPLAAAYVNDDQPLYTQSTKKNPKLNGTDEMTYSTHIYESIKTANMASPPEPNSIQKKEETNLSPDKLSPEINQDEDSNSGDEIRPLSALYSEKKVEESNTEPTSSSIPDPVISSPTSIVHTYDPPASYSSSSGAVVNMQNRPLPAESTTATKGKNSKRKTNQSRACSIM